MHILSALLVSVAIGAPVRAQSAPAALPEPPVEDRLKLWLSRQNSVRRKLAHAVARAHEVPAIETEADLKDAVASPKEPVLAPHEILDVDAPQRREFLAKLPGMAVEPFAGCRALEDCAEAPSSFHIEEDHQLQAAVIGLLRPWILLQTAQGRTPRFEAADDSSDRLMNVKLEGLPDASLAVFVTPLPSGGYDVSLGGQSDFAGLYRRERGAVLAASSHAG